MPMKKPRLFVWTNLPLPLQRQVALRVCSREERKLKRRARGNIVAVGIGVQYSKGERQCHECVAVFVKKKWKPGEEGVGRMPASLSAFVMWRGRRRKVAVPVDVVEDIPARAQSVAGDRCIASLDDDNSGEGVVCCLVDHNREGVPHVLSCHHVIFLTDARPEPSNSERQRLVLDFNGEFLSPPVDWQPLEVVDAALVPYADADTGTIAAGNFPKWITDVSQIPHDPATATIFTPRGPITVRFASYRGAKIGYKSGRVVPYPNIIFWDCEEDTEEGDSGSPVVNVNGALIGMHIAGGGKGSLRAMTVPIYEIREHIGAVIDPL